MSESTEGNGSVKEQDRPGTRAAGNGGQPEAFARVQQPSEPPRKPPLYKRPIPMIVLTVVMHE